jgi:hypothetical protein
MELRSLDSIRSTDLDPEIERRMASRDPLRPIPSSDHTGRRIVAGVVAFAVFSLAVAFATGALTDRPAPKPMGVLWSGYAEGWTELPAPPEWRYGAAVVWTGSKLLYWGGTPRGEDSSHAKADGFVFEPPARTGPARKRSSS